MASMLCRHVRPHDARRAAQPGSRAVAAAKPSVVEAGQHRSARSAVHCSLVRACVLHALAVSLSILTAAHLKHLHLKRCIPRSTGMSSALCCAEGVTVESLRLGNNIRTEAWCPQNDVLAHESVAAFFTQGGLPPCCRLWLYGCLV